MYIYANANKGRLPSHGANGVLWLWDYAEASRDTLMNISQKAGEDPARFQGASRDTLYCPSFQEQNIDDAWNYARNRPSQYAAPYFSVLGYYFLTYRPPLPRVSIFVPVPDPNFFESGFPLTNRSYIGSINPKVKKGPTKPAAIEIVTDQTISQASTVTAAGPWAASGGMIEKHVTAHVRRGVPMGSNTLYLDGHVTMKPFDKVRSMPGQPESDEIIRLRATRTGSPNTYFWF
jgi:prepilin-type processing-associated H-X9-DG protein